MKKIIAIIMLLLSFLSQVPAMGMEFSPDKPIHKGILPAVDLTTMPAETVHSMYCTNPGCPSKFATKDELSEHLKECPLDPNLLNHLLLVHKPFLISKAPSQLPQMHPLGASFLMLKKEYGQTQSLGPP